MEIEGSPAGCTAGEPPPAEGSGIEAGTLCTVDVFTEDEGRKWSNFIPLLYFASAFFEKEAIDEGRINVIEGRFTDREDFNCRNTVCG